MNKFITCKECALYGTKECYAVKAFKGVVLTPESGCSYGCKYGKQKERPQ